MARADQWGARLTHTVGRIRRPTQIRSIQSLNRLGIANPKTLSDIHLGTGVEARLFQAHPSVLQWCRRSLAVMPRGRMSRVLGGI